MICISVVVQALQQQQHQLLHIALAHVRAFPRTLQLYQLLDVIFGAFRRPRGLHKIHEESEPIWSLSSS